MNHQAMLDNARQYVVHHGAIHDDECPEDDTCSCSFRDVNEGIESLLRFAAESPASLAAVTAERDAARHSLAEACSQYQTLKEGASVNQELGATLIRQRDAAALERDAIAARCRELEGLAEDAWGIIANAHGGNWSLSVSGWSEAASRFRDKYHALLTPATPAAKPETPETPAFMPRRFVSRHREHPTSWWQTEPDGQIGFYRHGQRNFGSVFSIEKLTTDPDIREVPIPDETPAPTCRCPDCNAIREGYMPPLGYQCQGCGHSFADPIPTIYLSRGKCERCAAPTCGTCGGTKRVHMAPDGGVADPALYMRPCPACATTEGGEA